MRIIISIATKGDRPTQLSRTLQSLNGQADEIRIYDNSLRPDLTDNGKFYFLSEYKNSVYYLTCDDDLLYPSDYVKRMIEHIERHKCIISYHGRVLKPQRKTYYGSDHEGIHHWKPVSKPMRIDVAGTGCAGFRTDYFNPNIHNSEYKRMADLVFSLEAWNQGKVIVTPEKKMDYITEQEVKSSIFESESKGDQRGQIELMNKIIMCKTLSGVTTY